MDILFLTESLDAARDICPCLGVDHDMGVLPGGVDQVVGVHPISVGQVVGVLPGGVEQVVSVLPGVFDVVVLPVSLRAPLPSEPETRWNVDMWIGNYRCYV